MVQIKIIAIGDGKYKVHYFGWASKWDETVTPDRVRISTDPTFGREIDVEKNGSWTKVVIIDKRAGEHLVLYPGDSEEWVKDDRLRDIDPVTWSNERYGRKVEVLSKGKWYAARIMDKRPGEYYVHYEGYSESWDEWVTEKSIREIH